MTKKAKQELKDGLEKFKVRALARGWEEDEVNEKISEVFENFPWYKFDKPKKSVKSRIGKALFYLFILYLAVTAVLERNRRWRKDVDDFMFDNQFAYHSQRILRILTLPFYRFYDFSVHHNDECLIHNPFLTVPTEVDCVFCEGIKQILTVEVQDHDISDMLKSGSPFVVTNAPGYVNEVDAFDKLRQMIVSNAGQIDDASCKIRLVDSKTKVSDFFKMSEAEMIEKNASIAWRNCDTYGTRFYRRLYPRLQIIPKESEVYLEKEVMVLQKGLNMTAPSLDGETGLFAQIQGESVFSLRVPGDCITTCQPELKINVKQGQILAISHNVGWLTTLESVSDGVSIIYMSSFM